MKIQQLKKRVWKVWTTINSYCGELTSSPDDYVREIKEFGDRRYKKTWEAAYARLSAIAIHRGTLDAYSLILYTLNFTPEHPDYDYRDQILDEFMMIPDALDLIKMGLEQIFTSSDFTADEQREASHNGFFELLAGRKDQLRGTSIPVRAIGPLTGINA